MNIKINKNVRFKEWWVRRQKILLQAFIYIELTYFLKKVDPRSASERHVTSIGKQLGIDKLRASSTPKVRVV